MYDVCIDGMIGMIGMFDKLYKDLYIKQTNRYLYRISILWHFLI